MKCWCLLGTLLALHVNGAPYENGDRKCLPMKWECALVGQVAQVTHGQGAVVDVIASLSADYSLGMQAIVEKVYYQDTQIGMYKILSSQKATYFIDIGKETCTQLPGVAVTQLCSDNPALVHYSSWTVGKQVTDTYKYGQTTSNRGYLTLLRDSFSVVTQMISATSSTGSQFSALQFGNTTQGIRDPSVFNIPEVCKSLSALKEEHKNHLVMASFLP